MFRSFCEMMDRLPAAAAMKAAAVQRRMLEQDTAMGREEFAGEVASVLTFCRFLASADEGKPTVFQDVPLEHRLSYVKIVNKLVEAGELSPAAKDKFDGEFDKTLPQTAD